MSAVLLQETEMFYFVFCTMTKKCTINSRIVTPRYLLSPLTAVSLDGQVQSVLLQCVSLTRIGRNVIDEHVSALYRVGHEKVARLPKTFAFGYCINFCIYTMLRIRATFSWTTLPVFILMLRGRVGCLRQPTLPLSIRINTGSLYRNVTILNYKRDKDNVS